MGLIGAIVAAAALLIIGLAIFNMSADSRTKGREQLEKTVRRSVMAYYAEEGVYPESIEELKERYGIQIDDERYAVYYDIFAANLMPDITVLERTE